RPSITVAFSSPIRPTPRPCRGSPRLLRRGRPSPSRRPPRRSPTTRRRPSRKPTSSLDMACRIARSSASWPSRAGSPRTSLSGGAADRSARRLRVLRRAGGGPGPAASTGLPVAGRLRGPVDSAWSGRFRIRGPRAGAAIGDPGKDAARDVRAGATFEAGRSGGGGRQPVRGRATVLQPRRGARTRADRRDGGASGRAGSLGNAGRGFAPGDLSRIPQGRRAAAFRGGLRNALQPRDRIQGDGSLGRGDRRVSAREQGAGAHGRVLQPSRALLPGKGNAAAGDQVV